jgi:hypothetical protein
MNTIKIELTAEQITAIKNGVSTIELVQKEEAAGQLKPMSLKWENVVDKLEKPFWHASDNFGCINEDHLNERFSLPTRRDAVKARALTQLLTVMHYANGGEWVPTESDTSFEVYIEKRSGILSVDQSSLFVSAPIYFKTEKLARQAADDNYDLFMQYFTGVEVTNDK